MDSELIIALSSIIAGFTVGGMSTYISRKYKKFFLPFVFLAISFFSYGAAEIGYYYLEEIEELEPYGSVIDLVYSMYFVFALLHVGMTIYRLGAKFLQPEYHIIAVLVFGLLLSGYVIASLSYEELDYDWFVYGLSFVIMASLLAAFTVVAILKCRNTIIMRSWIFMGASILISSVIDVWYFTQENITGYEYGQFPLMDIGWFATDILIIIGIVYHNRSI